MGILDSLLGKKEEYPQLDAGSPAAQQIAEHTQELESLAKRANDRLEAVPGQQYLYVYVGDPPKQFGVVWYEHGEEYVFADEMQKRGLPGERIQELSDELREAYEASEGAPRFSYQVGDKQVIVTPADKLAANLNQAIHEVEEG